MKISLAKAKEALKAAELCYDNGLYDSCVRRSYYAMFWAAIASLEWVGYRPQKWTHGGLINVFGKEFVKRRNLISRQLAAYFRDCYYDRCIADYERVFITGKKAGKTLKHSQDFVAQMEGVIHEQIG
ncbi:MAG: HEPN domain-containing protein [Anaerolineae bacterium]